MRQGGFHLFPLGGSVLRGGTGGALSTYSDRIIFSQINDSSQIANTAAETVFDVNGSVDAIALNIVGAFIAVRFGGSYLTTGTPALTISLRFNSVVGQLINSASLTCPNNAANWGWMFEGGFVTRAIGSLGTIKPVTCRLSVANNTTGIGIVSLNRANTITPFDLTLPTKRAFIATAQWGAADPANIIFTEWMTLSVAYPRSTA